MTTRLAKILIASTVLAILPADDLRGKVELTPVRRAASTGASSTAVNTDSTGATTILNGQISFGAQWSTVNTVVDGAGGDVIVQSQGAGNALDVTTFNDTHVTSTQDSESTNIGSTINANISNVYGSVGITGQAFCNSTNISTDPAITEVHSDQVCHAQDPGSEVNANVGNVQRRRLDRIERLQATPPTPKTPTLCRAPATLHAERTPPTCSRRPTPSVHNVGGSVAVTSGAIGNNSADRPLLDRTTRPSTQLIQVPRRRLRGQTEASGKESEQLSLSVRLF